MKTLILVSTLKIVVTGFKILIGTTVVGVHSRK